MLIRTKGEYYELARAGLVGNSPRTWRSADEFLEDSTDALVGIRDTRPSSPRFVPYAPRVELRRLLDEQGLHDGEYYLTEHVAPEEVLLSGELAWFDGRWCFYYSRMKTHMRRALVEDGHYAFSFEALMLIKGSTTPDEWDDLLDLFEAYSPGGRYPVIELTIATRPHGIRQQHLLIWEVRHY